MRPGTYVSLLAWAGLMGGCMEVPDAAAANLHDGGRPLLLELPSPAKLTVEGGCQPGAPGWAAPGTSGDAGWAVGDASVAAAPGGAAGGAVPRPAEPGDVRVSEFMADPAALPDTDGEWIELHNPGVTAFDLTGCGLSDGQSGSAAIAGPLVIGAGGYVALARRPSPGFVPDAVVGLSLKNGGDVIVLRCSGVEIDRVDYTRGFSIASGASTQLDLAGLRRGLGAGGPDDWCLSVDAYSDDLGTPGTENRPCAPAPGDLDAGNP